MSATLITFVSGGQVLMVSRSLPHCFGDGCQSTAIAYDLVDYYSVTDDYVDNYIFNNMTHFGGNVGEDGFSINSNTFTFFFKSDWIIDGGHVIFDWECVKM